ncbi:MAG: hypothetical protein ACXACP_05900 [Candidatus Hodarchaeales archaeon]|jgi:hypothetical protein
MNGNFYRFWLLNEQGLYIFDQKLEKQIILPKHEEDKLIADLYNEFPDKTFDTPILHNDLNSIAFTRLYYQMYKRDLYIMLVDETIDIIEIDERFKIWKKVREKQRANLQGIIFSLFDDTQGTKVIYNTSLDDEAALLVAVQGQTISYMGKINEFKEGFKEALNVPNRTDLIHISYDFLVPAPQSTDPRIAKYGRVMNLYLLFPREFPHLKEESFLQFLGSFIDEWVHNWIEMQREKPRYPKQIFDILYEDLRATVNLAIDLATHDEREIRKLKDFVMDLLTQNQVLTFQVRKLQARVKELEGKTDNH